MISMDSLTVRNLPSDLPNLSRSTVDVWSFSLEPEDWDFNALAKTLRDDELMRAGRFFFDPDRNHFIVGRGLLRVLLGHYLQMEPEKIRFQYGHRGKPRIAGARPDWHFNL